MPHTAPPPVDRSEYDYSNRAWGEPPEPGAVIREYLDASGEKRICVSECLALASLLMREFVFPHPAPNGTGVLLYADCSDVFTWGCADSEPFSLEDLPDIFLHFEHDRQWGVAVWCIKKRRLRPQPAIAAVIDPAKWNLDAMELRPNPSDGAQP